MQVEGLREIESALVGFLKEAPGMVAGAQKAAFAPVLADAKRLVPKRTGALANALELVTRRASAMRASSGVEALSEVGIRISKKVAPVGTWVRGDSGQRSAARLNPRYYWHLVEFGTSHSAAKPYLRPAFDGNTSRMLSTFKSEMALRIERVRARYARRGRR